MNAFTRLRVRQFSQTVGSILPAIVLSICGFVHNVYVVVGLMSLSTFCMAWAPGGGYGTTIVDVSPSSCGILFSIANTLGNTSGILAPLVAGNIRSTNWPTVVQWRVIFFVAVGFFICGWIGFVLFVDVKEIGQLSADFDEED